MSNPPPGREGRLRLGPGFLVTAAFIGPGTVTAASSAGYQFGLELLWIIPLATLAAILLQEMAGRIGLVTDRPLGAALRLALPGQKSRAAFSALIFVAILFGNTAYQGGNLLGAVKGLDILSGGRVQNTLPVSLLVLTNFAIIAGFLLVTGSPKRVTRFLVSLVIIMSLLFLGIAFTVVPPLSEVSRGFTPRIPTNGFSTTLALFGTTIVPYNLFLYASLVRSKWSSAVAASQAIRESRIDIVLAVGLGGLVTASIMITGAAASSQNEFALDQLPVQLGHLLSPDVARLILGLGLVGAGLSSAITAPLAACYAAAGIFDWPTELKARQNRWVFGTVLIAGWAVGAIGILWQVRPEWAIIIAQAANGMILPVLALLLWWVASKRSILGDFVTGRFANIASFLVVATLSVIWLINLVGRLWSRFGGG